MRRSGSHRGRRADRLRRGPLAPGSAGSGEQHHVGLVPILVTFGVFALLSLSAIVYFHKLPIEKAETETETDEESTEGPVGLATA